MPEPLTDTPFDMAEIIENIVTEDDEPVDNLFSEMQQRLLVTSPASSPTGESA